ncbi:SUMF1/EgtB/PvdO family nonheme iron enzyme [Lyngbya sp. CCY1209]|uniref:nSTAND1 domain-containing NTPase n=1 Tax=Lyngbya sp. CCY1209 TaxID=2886103 RepID=UPI0035C906F1
MNERTELASQIINLPWEFLCYPDDNHTFLATHPRVALSCGYQTWLNNPLEGYAVRDLPLRVLFVCGRLSKLEAVGFVSLVNRVLSELGDSVEVETLDNPTPEILSETLKEKSPHILHFLGQGKKGALALGDLPDGETSWLSDQSLSDVLRVGGVKGVKLVVLQACEGASPSEELAFTGTAATLVETHIPAAVAIRYPISQPQAWKFVKTFYGKLAAGKPVDVAVQAGREQLAIGNQSHNRRDFGAPVLWMRLRDGLLFAGDKERPEEEGETDAEPLRDETGEVICPYQGLKSFTEETRQFFFGRVRKVEEIEQKLSRRNFVPVIGESGSGKSSVVLAGVMPRFKELEGWNILSTIRPGSQPLHQIKTVFNPYFNQSIKERKKLNDYIKKNPPNLPGLIERLPGTERFLLVIDQFEELFTLCDNEDDQKQFINLLSQVETQSRLSVVVTLRSDFLTECLKDADLSQLIENPVFMPYLERENLVTVIVRPARRQGYELAGGLLGEILQDVAKERATLPLLEFALTRLWERRDEKRKQLTLEGYEAIGRLAGALDEHATKVYHYRDYEEENPQDRRSEMEKDLIQKIFLKLLQVGEGEKETRLPQLKADIFSIGGDDWEKRERLTELIDGDCGLVKGRLLVAGESEVDLTHEVLISGWKQLDAWRTETRKSRKFAKQLERDAEDWWKHDKSGDFLWQGLRLEAGEKVLEEYATVLSFSPLAREFLETSWHQELCNYLTDKKVDSLNQQGLEKDAADKSYLTKDNLGKLLDSEREETKVRLAASWLLKRWGEDVPMRTAKTDREGNVWLRVIDSPPIEIEDLGDGIYLELVRVPGGEFWMGSEEGEVGSYNDEYPRHKVRVSGYWMGKYPVTQAQWRAVANLPKIQRDLKPYPSYFKGEDLPVERVSWYDAIEFCARLSRKTNRCYRLPSETEWEYACRAGTKTAFAFGNTLTGDLANSTAASRNRTTPVGRFQVANAFGLYDMHGNVWEWCADPWHDHYDGAPSDSRVWDEKSDKSYYSQYINFIVKLLGDKRKRVLHGGSWSYNLENCRCAHRSWDVPDFLYNSLGFRVVCPALETLSP